MTDSVALCGFWPHATAEAALALRDSWVTVLPETAEPDTVRHAGDPVHVVTVVPADLLLDGITDDLYGDLVCRQIEQADTVVLTGSPDSDDAWEAEQLRLLLHRIAPWARHRDLDSLAAAGSPMAGLRELVSGRRAPVAPLTRGLRGLPVGVHEPVPDHGVVASVFRARRPFHPARLRDSLDDITAGVLRSRGHLWVANRPDEVLTWESTASVRLGRAGGWLADLPGERWADFDSERCLAADLDWDPYYGDRHHHLAFVGVDLDPVRLHRTLATCLLTDDELSRGEKGWRRLGGPRG